eukprot:g28602.t1
MVGDAAKAWRIDFTTVRASGADPKDQQVSYEVELELNSQMLHQNLEAKLENKQHKLSLGWRSATAVNLFYDGPGTGTVRAIATIKNASVDAANNSTNAYNAENYVLWDPFEGEMVVLFIDLMGNWSNYTDPQAEKDKIWNIKAQHVDPVLYNESNNTYVIQEGFWFSAHEQWKTLQLPYLQIPLVHHLFRNGEMARLTFSVVKNLNLDPCFFHVSFFVGNTNIF